MSPRLRPVAGPVNYRVQAVTFRVVRDGAVAWTSRPTMSTPAEVVAVARQMIPDDSREHFLALYLDSQNRLVATHEVSTGTLSASLRSEERRVGKERRSRRGSARGEQRRGA